ncbi:MAG: MFS transporter [Anaerolineae bacterium]|nr:MFS transporter [Anaerolineae bacterium]
MFPFWKMTLRWLLQVDPPVPQRDEAEVTAEMNRNFRWNFVVNVLDGSSFMLGLSFISATTIVPLFLSKLTDSAIPIGLAAVIAQGSWFLPQLFTANVVERLARKKPVVINLGFFTERLPMWLILLAAVVAAASPTLALILFFIGYAWHGLGAGLIATAWQDMLARIFPVNRRGRFFGLVMLIGAGLGTVGASLSAWLLKTYPFPLNFVYCFAIAAIGINLSWVFLALTREPVQAVSVPRRETRQYWAELRPLLRQDRNFRHFLIARLLLALSGMGIGFLTLAAIRQWQIADNVVGWYTALTLLGQTFGNVLFGLLADRYGHKLSLELSGAAAALSFALAWLAPDPAWYYPIFALQGISQGGILVSGMMVVLEFSPADRRPTYTGLANTLVGLVSAAAPLLGVLLAQISYPTLFAVSALAALAGLLYMVWQVKEPRSGV